jgi:sulfate/thiosulfate-binding protein
MKSVLQGRFYILLSFFALVLLFNPGQTDASSALLNVSYDPTSELYRDFNAAFVKFWESKTKEKIKINQSHGGSGKQARGVIDGLPADVVTLALAYDIDVISERGHLLPLNWQSRLPYQSSPYTSTIVFLVRKGNPKGIKDWPDLVKPGVSIIPANPKTSGGARWTYLAAYGYALKANQGDESKARAYVTAFYRNVPVLDSGARGATTTFVERGIGDVLVGWENEALLAIKEIGNQRFEVIVPSVSILAQPPVALVDKNADKHKNRILAEAYLNYLYSEEGQNIVAKHFYRPVDPGIAEKYSVQYPKLTLFTIDDTFGGWKKAQKIHFSDGGIFDQVYQPLAR